MKALSVLQPWAEAIVDGFKTVENRTWGTKYRGRLVIHAGQSRKKLAEGGRLLVRAGWDPDKRSLAFGAAIGEVTLVDCVHIRDAPTELRNDRLVCGPWCWLLADAMRYWEPMPVRGKLGLFEIEDPALMRRAGGRQC